MTKALSLVVVGDGAVGKTSLLISYTTDKFPVGYIPTVFETYSVSLNIANEPFNLQLVDTAGQEDFDCLRPLSYIQADVFLVCFCVTDLGSLENVESKWIPEIRHHKPMTPFILVGTKVDCRGNAAIVSEMGKQHQKPVSFESGKLLAKKVGAVKYVECSALTQIGLKNVFDQAILAAYYSHFPPKKGKSRCSVM